jgi:hypothetical protein
MGGRIRGLGTSEPWLSLVYKAILLVSLTYREIHACDMFLVFFTQFVGFLF